MDSSFIKPILILVSSYDQMNIPSPPPLPPSISLS